MFNVGLGELLVIFGFVLVFWGPQALPEIGKNLGKFVRSMRDFARDVRGELGTAASEFDEIRETVDSIKNPIAAFAKEIIEPSASPPPRRDAKAYAVRADDDDYLAGENTGAAAFDSESFERSYAAQAEDKKEIAGSPESSEFAVETDDYLSGEGKADA